MTIYGGPMSRQASLVRDVGRTRDELDRYYTPAPLARHIVQRLAQRGPVGDIMEPSVGAGAFVLAIRLHMPGARLVGVDIDPAAEGLRLCDEAIVGDWLEPRHRRYDLAVGNPPFSGTTAIAHVRRCLEVADVVALVLPWAPLGGVQAWDDLLDGTYRPVEVWPIVPRPWPASVRETAVYVWDTTAPRPDATVVRRLPRWRT